MLISGAIENGSVISGFVLKHIKSCEEVSPMKEVLANVYKSIFEFSLSVPH